VGRAFESGGTRCVRGIGGTGGADESWAMSVGGARDMNLPGLDLHELRGSRKGTWAVTVSGNWRVTFTCIGKDVDRVDYEDYH
jgi:hypothetical protein